MKRDKNLIEKILKYVESESTSSSISIEGYPSNIVSEHLALMVKDGLIEGKINRVAGQKTPIVSVEGITSKGHDLLEEVERDEIIEKIIEAKNLDLSSRELEDYIPKKDETSPEILALLNEIVRLVNIGNHEEKIKAIEIYKENCKEIPNDFSWEFLRIMWIDEDPEIKKIASHYRNERAVDLFTKAFNANRNIINRYYRSMDQAINKAANIAHLFDISHTTAEVLRKSMIDYNKIYRNNLSEYLQEQVKILPSVINYPQIGYTGSPIGTLTEIINSFPKTSEEIDIPSVYSRSEGEKIETQLDEIIISDRDFSFNIAGYELLIKLETMLRDLIYQQIMIDNNKDLKSKIPETVLEDMIALKKSEESNPYVEGEYNFIEYSDFTHLKLIFEKRTSKSLFKGIYSEEELKGVATKLGEINPIRKKIAHSRPLTKREFVRLNLYVSDICKKLIKPNNT